MQRKHTLNINMNFDDLRVLCYLRNHLASFFNNSSGYYFSYEKICFIRKISQNLFIQN